MSNYSKIYWLTRLDNIQVLFFVLIVISAIAVIAYLVSYSAIYEYGKGETEAAQSRFSKKNKWIVKYSLISFILSFLIVTFLPSKNDMIVIYAGGKTMNYIQSDTSLAKIPYQTTTIISNYLDKQINVLKK